MDPLSSLTTVTRLTYKNSPTGVYAEKPVLMYRQHELETGSPGDQVYGMRAPVDFETAELP